MTAMLPEQHRRSSGTTCFLNDYEREIINEGVGTYSEIQVVKRGDMGGVYKGHFLKEKNMEGIGEVLVSLVELIANEETALKAEKAVKAWTPLISRVCASIYETGTKRKCERFKAYCEAGISADMAVALIIEEIRMVGGMMKK